MQQIWIVIPFDTQLYRTVLRATQCLHHFVTTHFRTGKDRIINGYNSVERFQTGFFRRSAWNNADHQNRIGLHIERNPDTAE